MNYEVIALEEFQRDVKKLHKKYRHIKDDILELVEKLEIAFDIGIHLGNNLYKIRVKNSDTGGNSGGYRVVYYTKTSQDKVYLITMYSKTQKENIDMSKLKPLLEKVENL
ncbi:MAG: type II toxin-antitoxin system RelE/ParE family toxin [Sulfurovum sp.]|nr:type II toxin-antitoxin system RelE/ParE family toxin [Sulfurovum sp.]